MRVSATNIDSYRFYRQDEEGITSLEKLIAQLRREEPPSEKMLVGSALHKALELAEEGEHKFLSQDGYSFEFSTDATIDLPCIREIKATEKWMVDGAPITLVGVADCVSGWRIDDHKTTSSSFDAEKYLNSFQWRIYLELFGIDVFRWNVFEMRQDRNNWKHYHIRDVHRLQAYRYPGMRQDIEDELKMFVDFASTYLPDHFRKEAA